MNVELIIAGYAAVVSTFVLVWELTKFYIEKKSKVDVKIVYNVLPKLDMYTDKHILKGYFKVTILNIGHSDIYINSRYLFEKKNKKIIDFFPVFNRDPEIKFPILLKPKQSLSENVDVNYVLFPASIGEELRVTVIDSLGKYHKSNFIKINKSHFEYFKN